MNEIVNVNQVSKAFQDKHAVKEASFSINKERSLPYWDQMGLEKQQLFR